MAFEKFYKPGKAKPEPEKEYKPRKPVRKSAPSKPRAELTPPVEPTKEESYRLNKYVSNAGICSRRKADELIAAGEVEVNGVVVAEPGYKTQPGDKVTYKGKTIKPQEQMIYILMNKPKGVITTMSDEKDRKTIMDILKGKVTARVYPVGRLDRETTGLLLITNDGDLTKKLSHPSHEVKKIYHITLNKALAESDFVKIKTGLTLEDGIIKVDGISYVKDAQANEIGITIHSGRNRIVRRIFESLGYEVTHLDRVYYGGLTKKDLPRSRIRFLTKQEIIMLKHFNKK